MRVSLSNRTVTLGVGEFAGFTDRPVSGGDTGRARGTWRAEVGQAWHAALREKREAGAGEAAFEVPLEANWPHAGWVFELRGRIDQVERTETTVVLREIKTTSRPLPAHESDLLAEHPAWFVQLAAYVHLYPLAWPTGGLPVEGELVFVEFQTGITQTVRPGAAAGGHFTGQLERLTRFLETRREHLERLRDFTFAPAFPVPRDGQETVVEDLRQSLGDTRIGLFEAPTGYGKTAAVLEHALRSLRDGAFSRVVYLTGKSTGQLQAAAELRRMLGAGGPVAFQQVRNKAEHCVNSQFFCTREACAYLRDLESRWEGSGLARFFNGGGFDLDLPFLREEGRRAGVCPYEITRSLLPFADVWLGDYNYVFSPAHAVLFDGQPGFDPAETLLIVDEAHNLPSRAADAFSASASVGETMEVMTRLEFGGARGSLLRAWEEWLSALSQLPVTDRLTEPEEKDLAEAADRVCGAWNATPPDINALGPETMDRVGDLFHLRQLLQDDRLERLLWSPERGVLLFSCLDASAHTAAVLRGFGQAVLMSATFGPLPSYLKAVGLEPGGAAFFAAEAPWRRRACRVTVDARVDTRWRSRKRHLPVTAATIAGLAAQSPAPVAVFFSSYRYAEDVKNEIEAAHGTARVTLQQRGLPLERQAGFLEEALLLSDAVFLILGSGFSEGIDLLGGRIHHAVIVGPALPEVNPVQNARLAALGHLAREEAFHEVYEIPGMQRVNQALGRLVRAPGHTIDILLHCSRFAEPRLASLLHPDHRPSDYLLDEADWERWLRDSYLPVE